MTRLLADERARRALRDYVDDWLDADKLRAPGATRCCSRSSAGRWPPTCARRCTGCSRGWSGRTTPIWWSVLRSERTSVSPALARLYGLPRAGRGRGLPSRLWRRRADALWSADAGRGSSPSPRWAARARRLSIAASSCCATSSAGRARAAQQRARAALGRHGKSERDRLAQHRKPTPPAAPATTRFDPLGLAFEAYDAIGAHRDAWTSRATRLTGAGACRSRARRSPTSNIREFVAALARTRRSRRCLSRKVVQYSFARPLEPGDDAFADELIARFAQGGHRYRGLLAATAASPWLRAEGVAKSTRRIRMGRLVCQPAAGAARARWSRSACRCCRSSAGRRRAATPPQRLVTFFFGNGMPPAYSAAGFASPVLTPLAPARQQDRAAPRRRQPLGPRRRRASRTRAARRASPSATPTPRSRRRAASRWTSPPTRPGSRRRRCRRWPPRCGGGRRTSSATPTRGRGAAAPTLASRGRSISSTASSAGGHAAGGGQRRGGAALKQRRYDRSVLDSVLEGYRA